MKKIYLILNVFAVIFISCDTDFDVNANWEETTVVFGLLDASNDIQFVKINKAFLGEADAELMASFSDSVNYNPTELEVVLYKMNFNDTIDFRVLKDTVIEKEDGLFSTENNIVYYFNSPISDDFLKSEFKYELVIANKVTGNVVSGYTDLISSFSFSDPSSNNSSAIYKFNFYNPFLLDSAKYQTKLVKWNPSKNGKIYQVDIIFEYIEDDDTENPIKLTWNQPLITNSNGNEMYTELSAQRFFAFLRNNITEDSLKIRSFENLTLKMSVGTTDFETYLNVNKPFTGIVQERPQFSNINNGIGLFSSRRTHVRNNVTLHSNTQDYLIDELDRNFK